MAKRNRFLGKNKTESASTAEMRLQRYVDTDVVRRAKDNMQSKFSTKALKTTNSNASKVLDVEENSIEDAPDWRAEAARRLAVAENKWPHKLGTNLRKWSGRKPNGSSGHFKKSETR